MAISEPAFTAPAAAADAKPGPGFANPEARYRVLDVPSRFLPANRLARVYLPASYTRESARRYPVLYLHDGQNAFTFAGTNVAFGWGNWEVDRTADRLSREGKLQELILVAVDNSPARFQEYGGRHGAPDAANKTPFENYSAFLVQELKPRIDASFRTHPEATHTGVMGSSMGGLCSLVLAWDHPEIFGKAASLSGAFMVEQTNFLRQVLGPFTGPAKATRLYLDSGVRDFMGGDDGRALTAQVAEAFRRLGWGKELLYYLDAKPLTVPELEQTGLRRDKWAEAQTSQHNEFYWRLRVWRALTFLFPSPPS